MRAGHSALMSSSGGVYGESFTVSVRRPSHPSLPLTSRPAVFFERLLLSYLLRSTSFQFQLWAIEGLRFFSLVLLFPADHDAPEDCGPRHRPEKTLWEIWLLKKKIDSLPHHWETGDFPPAEGSESIIGKFMFWNRRHRYREKGQVLDPRNGKSESSESRGCSKMPFVHDSDDPPRRQSSITTEIHLEAVPSGCYGAGRFDQNALAAIHSPSERLGKKPPEQTHADDDQPQRGLCCRANRRTLLSYSFLLSSVWPSFARLRPTLKHPS